MKKEDINIRDPFILLDDGKYYLYGTRGSESFTRKATGLDVYVSDDLEDFEGPFVVFTPPSDFFSDKNYWAPEVYHYNGKYYMFATFAYGKKMGTSSLVSDSPMGPFELLSDKTLTPQDWRCLDGTLYISQKAEPYIVFCREWKEVKDGRIYSAKLKEDLSALKEDPVYLFSASDAGPLVRKFMFNKYVTDGPYFYRSETGRLHMMWSTHGPKGYCQLLAHSDNNEIDGKWSVDPKALFDKDGGHGMIFKDKNDTLKMVLHYPNKVGSEHPVFFDLDDENGVLSRKDQNR
ncbi:MAG: family 43 glycosylhydrolase [Erysipelotrichaceae bacterium]|nr:family 43 glycosylhydrolase [Erysipelotrichaceae bacterium]